MKEAKTATTNTFCTAISWNEDCRSSKLFLRRIPEKYQPRSTRLRQLGYSTAVVKAQIGASGYGMIKLNTQNPRLDSMPNYLFFEGPCMVQGWLDEERPGVRRIGSPSIQMFLDDHTVSLFDWTEQILSEASVHEGNMSPPPYIRRTP